MASPTQPRAFNSVPFFTGGKDTREVITSYCMWTHTSFYFKIAYYQYWMEYVTEKGLVGDTNTLNGGGELKERKAAQREEERRASTSSAGNTKTPSLPRPCDPERFPKSSVPLFFSATTIQREPAHAQWQPLQQLLPNPEGFQPQLVGSRPHWVLHFSGCTNQDWLTCQDSQPHWQTCMQSQSWRHSMPISRVTLCPHIREVLMVASRPQGPKSSTNKRKGALTTLCPLFRSVFLNCRLFDITFTPIEVCFINMPSLMHSLVC